MKNQILIQEAFRVYDKKMTRIFQELNFIKESYSISEQRQIQLIFEGIFSNIANALKTGFEKTTGTAGNIVGNIMKAAEETYNKAVELGKKTIIYSIHGHWRIWRKKLKPCILQPLLLVRDHLLMSLNLIGDVSAQR